MGRVRADDVFGDVGLMLCEGHDGIWVLITISDISLSCAVWDCHSTRSIHVISNSPPPLPLGLVVGLAIGPHAW